MPEIYFDAILSTYIIVLVSIDTDTEYWNIVLVNQVVNLRMLKIKLSMLYAWNTQGFIMMFGMAYVGKHHVITKHRNFQFSKKLSILKYQTFQYRYQYFSTHIAHQYLWIPLT